MTERLENQYMPDYVTPPGETLEEILDTIGMSKAELAGRIGKTPKTIGEIIKHGAPITPATAMELEKALGTPASFWNNRERRYRESVARQQERKRLKQEADWLKTLPVPEMIKAGWIKKLDDRIEQVDEVLRFFGVASSKQWKTLWLSCAPSFRESKAFANKPESCSVWLRKGELEAQQIDCKPFNKERFRLALDAIRLLTRTEPEQFETKTVQKCAEAGVAVVFVPPIKGAPVYGATRWLTSDKALIQLSLRGKFEDLLWFTFFHEAGHILLHGKKEVFIEDNDNKTTKEVQADRFAANFLVPKASWQRFVSSGNYQRATAVREFAALLEISPAVVVGRLQHEKLIPYSHLNGLRRKFQLKDG
jgi:HTH-type transcriptional regulator/antitoxin HigA